MPQGPHRRLGASSQVTRGDDSTGAHRIAPTCHPTADDILMGGSMMTNASRRTVGLWLGIGGAILALVGVSVAVANASASRPPSPAAAETATIPPPPPPLVPPPSSSPASHPIWPAEADGPTYSSATDLARDFATRALGISDPAVHEPASVRESGIGSVTIALPTLELAVLAQRTLNGSWEIIQVGDQTRLEGITMLPDGQPGPVMTIHPPADAATAEVTVRTADGTHELHLTAEDLRAGVAHLTARNNPTIHPTARIHTVLIVYRDRTIRTIDALAGQFS